MNKKNNSYWKSNLKILAFLMTIWFLASFGFGIIWSDALDEIQIGALN